MSGFAHSFWSGDYAGGLGVLFGKLQQGVQENQQIMTIARLRADAEESYGQRLAEIGPATERISGGFQRDEGASVRKAFEGVRREMDDAARNHRKIASNIRELVVVPFGRWCEAHAARVQSSQDDLQSRIKIHDRQADAVRSFRSQYYNKCRRVEDLEEEDKLAFQDPQSANSQQSPTIKNVPTLKLSEPDEAEDEPIEIGDETYAPEQVKKILTHMLDTIKIGETRVPILGIYQNVSSGSDITEYLQKHMSATSVSYAERIGQDLVNHGFLRLVGNVGSTFANSSRMFYQWRPKVFQMTGIPDKKKPLERTSSAMSSDSVDSPVGAVGEMLMGWNPLNNPYPNETPSEKLRREAREADEKYKASVRKLDSLRCNLEEAMIDHLKFMERCELDRLRAIKSVILDFSGAISNVIPSLQSTVDNMMLFQETVQPMGDLRYLLENYRTGQFVPKVVIYENYYNNVDEQTFGVDLEARARADRKRVPIIITTLLTYLDNHYPDLEGDEARRGIWLVDVPLAPTHHLRTAINTGKNVPQEVLEKYDVPIVANVLKLYLLELPDSLVSSHLYEIVKTIYSTTAPSSTEGTRISVLQSTLGQLRLANIATLDAISTHFTRLIELTSADEDYVTALANVLAPIVLRPKQETTLTMEERYPFRLLRDLFTHKDAIFGELKRASSVAQTTPTSSNRRPRAISTDESSRRAHMEERQRAIANRSRASSPAPGPRSGGHRRDRSTGGPETRFPISTSAGGASERRLSQLGNRMSLDVPDSAHSPPDNAAADTSRDYTNNSTTAASAVNGSNPEEAIVSPTSADSDKRDSLNSGGNRFSRSSLAGKARQAGGLPHRESVGSKADGVKGDNTAIDSPVAAKAAPIGVELVDRPMDD